MISIDRRIIKGTGHLKVLVVGGLHGNEVTSLRLVAGLDVNSLETEHFSELHIYNAVNVSGIVANERDYYGNTKIDPNRYFKEPDETIETLNHLKDIVREFDVVFDVHSSARCAPMFLINNDEWARHILKMMKDRYRLRNYVIWVGSDDTLKSYALNECNTLAFTIEVPGLDMISYDGVSTGTSFIRESLEYIHHNPEYASNVESGKTLPTSLMVQQTPILYDGFFVERAGLGDTVYKGDTIGAVRALNESTSKKVLASISGKIMAFPSRSMVFRGDSSILIQPDAINIEEES